MFRDETARRGLAAHLAVAQRLVELGYEVLEPFGDHLRYDLAYYQPEERRLLSKIPAELVRIQCKTGRLLEGRSISFNLNQRGCFGVTGSPVNVKSGLKRTEAAICGLKTTSYKRQ